MSWPTNPRPARSLTVLLDEVNARWPNRSKASDGLLGDASHQTRDSDHNPWVKDGTTGVVTAVDITDDAAPGVPEIADLIVQTLVQRRDARVKYLIHEGTMWRSYDKPGIPAWEPAPYTGTNGHFAHAHVSVWDEKDLYDFTAPWGIALPVAPVPPDRPKKVVAVLNALRALRHSARKAGNEKRAQLAQAHIDEFKRDFPG